MANKKVLVIEDDPMYRRILVDTLKKENCTVIEADNGRKGLELALKEHPDLIMVDIMMPVMSGMEMAKELRKDAWGKNASLIILTNLTSEKTIAEFLADGAYDYLIKTAWTANEIIKRVMQKLEMTK